MKATLRLCRILFRHGLAENTGYRSFVSREIRESVPNIKRSFRHKCPEFYLLLNKWSLSACNALFLSSDLISRETL